MKGVAMPFELLKAEIIDRGRGPEIAGTRITVYDVMDYRKHGWHRDRIAGQFLLSSEQIQAALDYIDAHKEEVQRDYDAMLEWQRNYRYPPDVQAKIDATKGRAAKRLAELRAKHKDNGNDAGDLV
jgi:uncharacterized protein (DUF433 family)